MRFTTQPPFVLQPHWGGVALSSPVNSVKGEVEVVYGPTGPFSWAYWPFLERSGATAHGPTVLEGGFCGGSVLSVLVSEEAERRRFDGRLNAIRDAQLRSDAPDVLFYGAHTDMQVPSDVLVG
jgi:hypothetical protein